MKRETKLQLLELLRFILGLALAFGVAYAIPVFLEYFYWR